MEALGAAPHPVGRAAGLIARLSEPMMAHAFLQIARRDYLAELGELTALLSPELEQRLVRASRFPEPMDPPGVQPADLGEVAGLGLRGSGWDQLSGERPTPDSVYVTAQRRDHILDGDGPKSGGHRYGTGKPDKTEFPPGWSDAHIIESIIGVARSPDPNDDPKLQKNNRWRVRGVRDGVTIEVIVDKASGHVVTAYPIAGRDVHRNPPG